MSARRYTPLDETLSVAQSALATLWGRPAASRPNPGRHVAAAIDDLSPEQRRESGALMRVNHVGEVCAQALYTAQALATSDAELRRHFQDAAIEETDHLAWTQERLAELGSRPSLLNPFWYAGAFALGLVAGRIGDRASLGFVIETERQVEQHLESHLTRLPEQDTASRDIVRQMRDDEARHADEALALGGQRPAAPVRLAMRLAARVMTTTAHRI